MAQLRRILGDSPTGLDRVNELLARAVEPLRPEGRALFAGLSSLGLPDEPLAAMWRRGDLLREYRGDSHLAAWVSADLDATEIGLLTELYWRLPMRTYSRTRAWTADQFDAATERLERRGLVADGAFTERGRALREQIEEHTDAQMRPRARRARRRHRRAVRPARAVERRHPRGEGLPGLRSPRPGSRLPPTRTEVTT